MKALSCLSDPLCKSSLYKRMDILITGTSRNDQSALVQILPDPFQSLYNIVSVLLRKDSLLCQHLYMSNASSDILTVKFLIK